MAENNSDHKCHQREDSVETKSCLTRASFAFMTNFEHFFFKYVFIPTQ